MTRQSGLFVNREYALYGTGWHWPGTELIAASRNLSTACAFFFLRRGLRVSAKASVFEVLYPSLIACQSAVPNDTCVVASAH